MAPMGIGAVARSLVSVILAARPGRAWLRRFRPRAAVVSAPPSQARQQVASASWMATGTMMIAALSGPDVANLWAAYLRAKQAAINAHQALEFGRTAYNTDFTGYVLGAQFYVLDRAADQAYKAWADATVYWQREQSIFAAYGGGQ